MKKLLILGGSKYIVPVIKKAHDLGVFVISCDYLPNNYGHKFSDKYLNISIIDKEKVLEAAKNEKIDGIISFACDPGVETACYVAEKLSLPNVGPYESICILQNKNNFRSFLEKNGFNTPFHKSYLSMEEVEKEKDKLIYPVIVKPTDSAGSKGVAKVTNSEELSIAASKAFSASIYKEIIVEEFLDCRGFQSDADSFFRNGELLYFGTSSQMYDSGSNNPFVPSSYFWPSTISKQNLSYFKTELTRLFTLLRIKTAIFNIELRENSQGKPYIMEASPRGGGNRLSEMVEFMTGQDLITEYLKYSLNLGGEETKITQVSSKDGWCEIILHSNKEGEFLDLEIDKNILPYLIDKDLWVKKGSRVSGFTGADQTIGTLIFKFENKQQMMKFLNNLKKYLNVIVR